jgi:hypothetical protein
MSKYIDKADPLLKYLPKDQVDVVMNQDMCELDYTFLGFTEIYEHLSKIIPVNFLVIDFGCYLAAQSYYFRKHKGYIGVDTTKLKRFGFTNTEHYYMSIQLFIQVLLPRYVPDKIFAICSYVPDEEAKELVRESCKNVFVFYPCSEYVPRMMI